MVYWYVHAGSLFNSVQLAAHLVCVSPNAITSQHELVTCAERMYQRLYGETNSLIPLLLSANSSGYIFADVWMISYIHRPVLLASTPSAVASAMTSLFRVIATRLTAVKLPTDFPTKPLATLACLIGGGDGEMRRLLRNYLDNIAADPATSIDDARFALQALTVLAIPTVDVLHPQIDDVEIHPPQPMRVFAAHVRNMFGIARATMRPKSLSGSVCLSIMNVVTNGGRLDHRSLSCEMQVYY